MKQITLNFRDGSKVIPYHGEHIVVLFDYRDENGEDKKAVASTVGGEFVAYNKGYWVLLEEVVSAIEQAEELSVFELQARGRLEWQMVQTKKPIRSYLVQWSHDENSEWEDLFTVETEGRARTWVRKLSGSTAKGKARYIRCTTAYEVAEQDGGAE